MDLLLIFLCVCLLLQPQLVSSFGRHGATELKPHEMMAPWVVGVFDKDNKYICNGALVGKHGEWGYVVTVWAGCGEFAAKIVAGAKDSSDLKVDGSKGQVKVLGLASQEPKKRHPCSMYDIARLKLSEPLKKTENVRGIGLNYQHEPIKMAGELTGFLYSWGFPAGSDSRKLAKVEVKVSSDKCNDKGKSDHTSPDFHFCVSAMGSAKLCDNDRGGPLIANTKGKDKFNYLVGFLSYNGTDKDCAGDFKEALIVDMTKFYCFIAKEEELSCSTPDAKSFNQCKGSTFSQPLIFLVFLSTLVNYLLPARH